jgi:hypothetical protein
MRKLTAWEQQRLADWIRKPAREPFVRASAISYTLPEQNAVDVPIDQVIKYNMYLNFFLIL